MARSLRRLQALSTMTILVLSVLTTLSGILRPGHYRNPEALAVAYRAQDVTILVAGVPVLAAGLWHAARGSLRGRIVWLGGLAYMTYVWVSVGLQISFNAFFLVYVALFSLSLFTLVGGMATTDADAVRDALAGRISRPVYGGFLLFVAAGLATLWLSELVPAILAGTEPPLVEEAGPQALVSHFIDLSVVVPSLIVAGVWLWRDRTWGYVFAGVTLVLGAILAVTISAMTLVFLAGDAITISPVALIFTFLPILVAAALAVRYVASMKAA